MAQSISEAMPDMSLAEGSTFPTANPEAPLKRSVVVSIRSSLNDLCLKSGNGVWKPSGEALKSIFQQKKYTSLEGSAESQGDLGSIVLHSMDVAHVKSTFPCSLGARIFGVDDSTYSSTGDAFSTIILPNSECTASKKLQADDCALAYEFSKKFPGYTSSNLSEKGVHEVSQRRFVLVSADHPIVSAISENADKLQMGEISMMPEGLVKISSTLYESILPLVKSQVESQIKVRDFSQAEVTLAPAEFGSWAEARSALMTEMKRPLKAQLQKELGAANSDKDREDISAAFLSREAALEHDLDYRQLDLHLSLDCAYNFLSP
jgi:hypothetical protein